MTVHELDIGHVFLIGEEVVFTKESKWSDYDSSERTRVCDNTDSLYPGLK